MRRVLAGFVRSLGEVREVQGVTVREVPEVLAAFLEFTQFPEGGRQELVNAFVKNIAKA